MLLRILEHGKQKAEENFTELVTKRGPLYVTDIEMELH